MTSFSCSAKRICHAALPTKLHLLCFFAGYGIHQDHCRGEGEGGGRGGGENQKQKQKFFPQQIQLDKEPTKHDQRRNQNPDADRRRAGSDFERKQRIQETDQADPGGKRPVYFSAVGCKSVFVHPSGFGEPVQGAGWD
ncbi:unnamed protein product [Amoebophrya sp. A120]|nr:unnamed protein product [Amoebophrya sp. A120]|eukprot:GSA120T00001313001.1